MKPVFIGGTGRSGTTVMKKLLACHSGIAAIDQELRIHIDPGGALDLLDSMTRNWTPQNADSAIVRFEQLFRETTHSSYLGRLLDKLAILCGMSPTRYSGWKLDRYFGAKNCENALAKLKQALDVTSDSGRWAGSPPHRLAPRIHHVLPPSIEQTKYAIRCFFSTLYAGSIDGEPTFWVDDTPYNILAAERILEVWPDALFVHIHRDPMDVVASHQQQSWGGKDAPAIARKIAFTLEKTADVRNRLGDGRLIDVKLAQLAKSPNEEMSRILSFVGLGMNEHVESGLSKVSTPKVSAGRWRNDISPDCARECLQILGKSRTALGYE